MTIDPNAPEPGYYKRRMVKGGPWVAVRIWIDEGDREACALCGGWGIHGAGQDCGECGGVGSILVSDDVIKAERDGEAVDVWHVWPGCATRPITAQEYDYMIRRGLYAKAFEPASPAAQPRRPQDISKTDPVF